MPPLKNLTGQRFGRLVVIKRAENDKHKKTRWLCKCDCGNEKIIGSAQLMNGNTKSCGCYHNEMSIKNLKNKNNHGKSKTRLYKIYNDIKERCGNKNKKAYKNYGGRGIAMCQEWQDNFMNFYNWAIHNGYRDKLTIDRINNDGNYEPSNCRWITMKEQQRNRRNNHLITYNDETHCITEWAEILDISSSILTDRINKLKWGIEKALMTPKLERYSKQNGNKKSECV